MYRIYIVEDDPVIAKKMGAYLNSWGYDARIAGDFRNILEEFKELMPQLVLLDVTLPFYNGYHWCSEIRKVSRVPVIFVSSASDNMNIVMAINMGADDYISKPFELNILTAKVQAILRRTYDFGGSTGFLEHRGVVLNTDNQTLSYQEANVELTKNEYRILTVLLEQKGKTVSRDTLMERLWETDSYVDDNTLTVNMARLRKKLESMGLQGFIRTKKGMGYLVE